MLKKRTNSPEFPRSIDLSPRSRIQPLPKKPITLVSANEVTGFEDADRGDMEETDEQPAGFVPYNPSPNMTLKSSRMPRKTSPIRVRPNYQSIVGNKIRNMYEE